MQADIIANLPRQQRMLLGRIVADQQNRRRCINVGHAGSRIRLAAKSHSEGREVGGAVMVDIVRLQHRAREFREQVRFFFGRTRRSDHANCLAAIFVANFGKFLADEFEGLFPRGGSQLAVLPNQRMSEALLMVREIECIAALNAEEVSVGAALVPVITPDDLHSCVGAADAESRLAAVATVRADGAYVVHLPWAGLVAIGSGGERADRADIDAHAALFALQVIFFIGSDQRADAAVLHAESPDVHTLAADAHAAITKNAARPVKVDHRRPLLLFFVILRLHELRFGGAVAERHVLQFAFAASIANGAIQRMVPEQQFKHRLAGLLDLITFGGDDHALADHRGAGGLQFGHFLDLHQTHAASALQRKVGVIAKGGHFDAHGLAGLNEQRARGGGELLAIDSEIYISHEAVVSPWSFVVSQNQSAASD